MPFFKAFWEEIGCLRGFLARYTSVRSGGLLLFAFRWPLGFAGGIFDVVDLAGNRVLTSTVLAWRSANASVDNRRAEYHSAPQDERGICVWGGGNQFGGRRLAVM
jgi:hypothetical protein